MIGTGRRLSALALPAIVLAGGPAQAELHVRLSRPATRANESLGITVTDPLRAPRLNGVPVTVALSGPKGASVRFQISPAQPATWYGRIALREPGVYTGTVLLDGDRHKDIGFVPRFRVEPAVRPGPPRLHPESRRVLALDNGSLLFPVGVRLGPAELSPGNDWPGLLARLLDRGVNYAEAVVPWSESGPTADLRRGIDGLLLAAEQSGRFWVQVRLEGPGEASRVEADRIRQRIVSLIRLWAWSPALAAWSVAAAAEPLPSPERSRLLRAIRQADGSGRLVAAPPGRFGETPPQADLQAAPSNWRRPEIVPALMGDGTGEQDQPLPGEDNWQLLVLGGVGLPLIPYSPGDRDAAARLDRLAARAAVAASIPYGEPGVPMTGVIAVDLPGSFCRYGSTLAGWAVGLEAGPFEIPSLPRGRYLFRVWDADSDRLLARQEVISDGAGARARLPAGANAVFLLVTPLSQAAGSRTATR